MHLIQKKMQSSLSLKDLPLSKANISICDSQFLKVYKYLVVKLLCSLYIERHKHHLHGKNTLFAFQLHKPFLYYVTGMDIWPGVQVHSHNYRTPESCQNQVCKCWCFFFFSSSQIPLLLNYSYTVFHDCIQLERMYSCTGICELLVISIAVYSWKECTYRISKHYILLNF
jgi:hypothetical protein